RNGLLNTAISHQSYLTQCAQQNSLNSPLLLLPGEIRNKIWKLALGDHRVDIQDLINEKPIDTFHNERARYSHTLCPPGFIRPTFQLPRVCRQIYVEASPYVYMLNTFTFHNMATFDRWIKNRCIGQRRLVTSLDVPCTYARLYRSGFRKPFVSKFPNITRIGIDNWTLFCDYNEIRRLPENNGKGALELWVDAKAKIIAEVKDKEGQHLRIEWH
ncbi:uncharacterized protein M421DRAFT_13816, partial [Didymella exigua CBS 183.55]